MSTYVLMKILESASSRYDRGIRLLTFGRLDKVYDRLASYIKNGQRVLDIGCGTGALTFRATQKGAWVKGIDVNPQMLEIAQQRAVQAGFTQNVELVEMGVADAGHQVGRAGSQCPQSYSGLTRQPPVNIRHKRRSLLVARNDKLYGGVAQ